MSKLNKDILFLIFEELHDDSRSLFSCLIANRLWCETVIPILWKNPWCYNINYSNKNYLFLIIVSYLSDDIKGFLTSRGIQIPSFSNQSLLFDYLSFCRSINVNTIGIITSIGSSSTYNQFLLQQEFYGLFMRKFPELKYLDMKSIKHQIFYFPGARFRFESLCELKCDTTIDSSYFYGLAHLCQYIQRLIIINIELNDDYHGIAELIGVQKNLNYFEWKDDDSLYFPILDPYKKVLFALENKANTIIHLKISFVFIDCTLQKVLPKFHKLKTLIAAFDNFSDEQLEKCVHRDLEIFKIDYFNLNAASIIIGNSGGRLKKILLGPYDLEDDYVERFGEDSLILTRKIHESCPLIECLSLVLSPSKEHYIELEKLLKICQNLKLLLLVIVDHTYFEELTREITLRYGGELLKILSSTSTNIKEIRFCGDLEFSLEALEEFLEKWEGHALSILMSNYVYKRDDYKKLINRYKKNGIIKNFRCEPYMDIVNMDF
ncbi:hypothetical protein RclHR1_08150003 [Rhizophagus clarus]|uniref:F-box domain-containing protein n=1 Tax=Rhizophagus clarus TaxID=94130 RepID=A0A2Z6SF45_9GLOM|nr:hypothetical protein RclHR1_08150003 [Rhizophagus clarus]